MGGWYGWEVGEDGRLVGKGIDDEGVGEDGGG